MEKMISKMENMIDYVKRQRLSFEQEPFNEIDSMILAQLVYCDFASLIGKKRLGDISLDNQILKKLTDNAWAADDLKKLWPELINNPRYQDIKWEGAVDKIDAKSEMQFGAITFEFMPQHYYIAYRGTTATTIGWKENFDMSFENIVPAQFFARKYFRKRINYFPGKYYLGGHSKGGNLAFFVAVTANDKERLSIVRADSFDGPGFHQQRQRYDKKILALKGILHKYIPEGAIVGILMDDLVNNKDICQIINSRAIGPMQHNMFNWEVVGNHFVVIDELIPLSQIVQRTVDQLLKTTDDEERREFITTLYDAINVYDDIYIKNMFKPQAAREIVNSLMTYRKQDAKIWRPVVNKFVDASFDSGKSIVNNKKDEYLNSLQSIVNKFSDKHFFK